ncbi:cytochrome D1 domain-containing protein [Aurantimonas sp. C2-6-R+9]|uniref:cytochrome D1 domain-containing protein n=1 Tax=unclassified Aurantimonas TaxID=2638230 RepID=UPI002E17FB50|nr:MULTISPECIES: cytochrome D1 domain-containing protein [unclassified Aurantimonas]MEC5290932.1 cytochrome D1 domain-containing protein [Aurantimonas sp. C2-3-R2]MEC5381313.1 cytochrome D1 domain-containing protein [Aurantimonas sp. C2-6-R+9]MEC5412136.1 cytochrome D1 domain-containing protein [Aurantimonas sp. C2-4-R8]
MSRGFSLGLIMLASISAVFLGVAQAQEPRATGDLGVVVERTSGSLLIIDQSEHAAIGRVDGLGDLSHASVVFSADERFAFVFGRDGGLTKVDLLTQSIAGRVVQSGNAIGGAISDDGQLVAVSNYEPGGVRVFDAETLESVADIPTGSKTIGLVDAPGRRFVFTLWDAGETWIADFSGEEPAITRIGGIGTNPYDALITGDGRHYIAGLFGEDGLTALDLWQEPPVPRRILSGYGKGKEPLPVYKMPHLEGWALAGDRFVLPAVGRHEVLWVDSRTLAEVGRTATHGQPVFAVARPDGRQVWVNFAHPLNDTIEVIDTLSGEVIHTLTPGPAVLHMEFTARGHEVWVSVRDAGRVDIYDARSFEKLGEIAAESPSGIFFTARAHRTGL